MPVSPFARRVQPTKKRSALAQLLDDMPVDAEGYGEWVEIQENSNHVPAQIAFAQRRHPGREYVWEYDDIGVRFWRVA